jgi:hypothetical protein
MLSDAHDLTLVVFYRGCVRATLSLPPNTGHSLMAFVSMQAW